MLTGCRYAERRRRRQQQQEIERHGSGEASSSNKDAERKRAAEGKSIRANGAKAPRAGGETRRERSGKKAATSCDFLFCIPTDAGRGSDVVTRAEACDLHGGDAEEDSRSVGWPASSDYFDTDLRANAPKEGGVF